MVASSLRPMRRARISSRPAATSKTPLSVALRDRNRERPVVRAHHERGRLAGLAEDAVPGVIVRQKFLFHVVILHRVAGGDELLRARAEDAHDRLAVAASCGGHKSLNGRLRRLKALLRLCERGECEHQCRRTRQHGDLAQETNIACVDHGCSPLNSSLRRRMESAHRRQSTDCKSGIAGRVCRRRRADSRRGRG